VFNSLLRILVLAPPNLDLTEAALVVEPLPTDLLPVVELLVDLPAAAVLLPLTDLVEALVPLPDVLPLLCKIRLGSAKTRSGRRLVNKRTKRKTVNFMAELSLPFVLFSLL
jgi:hypothetical protein